MMMMMMMMMMMIEVFKKSVAKNASFIKNGQE
jgi:hypothetical protein